jgi:hypothetical protein
VKRFALLVVAGVLFGAGFVACKQGPGERCQVQDDCEDGLICNTTKQTCEGSGQGNPIDAAPPDGPKTDATVDAAPVDAPSAPQG